MKKIAKTIGAILALLILVLLVWGLSEPYTLDEERYIVPMPGLPAAWERATVAVVGDFQIGMWLDNENTVEDAIEAMVAADPAVALLLGDYVYHWVRTEDADLQHIGRLMAPLTEAGIPTYAVLGNHDYSLGSPGDEKREELAQAVSATLEAVGVTVLQNGALAVEPADGGAPLYIVGVGSHYAGNDFPETALAEVPAEAARVVIMHNPDSFEEVPEAAAPLAVAGHTHGGQISLPYTPDWSLMTLVQSEDEVHADAWVEAGYGARGNRLYITRGIGMSLLPLRILAQPEVTFFRLTRGSGDGLTAPTALD